MNFVKDAWGAIWFMFWLLIMCVVVVPAVLLWLLITNPKRFLEGPWHGS